MPWLSLTPQQFIVILCTAACLYFILMIFIKINGLRSFSKMSAHDFAVTIAIGSILGSVAVSETPTLLQGAAAIGSFLFLQACYSRWRIYRQRSYLENKPVLLMKDGYVYEDNLKTTKLTKADLLTKLREANVLRLEDVRAVIFEGTGDISVLHGSSELDDILLEDVVGGSESRKRLKNE